MADSTTPLSYEIEVADDLRQLDVKVCLPDPAPAFLYSANPGASRHLGAIRQLSDARTRILEPHVSGEVTVIRPDTPLPGDCIAYRVRLPADNLTHPWFKTKQSIADQVLIDISEWLWYPQRRERYVIELEFHLPQGVQLSAPGKRIASNGNRISYRIRNRPVSWEGRIAIGRFHTYTRRYPDGQMDIAILNGATGLSERDLLHWIDANVKALLQVYGELPVATTQLLIVPVGSASDAVPWGQAMRGGGDAVHLYIDQTRPLHEFMQDWVLIHEFSHLLHPRIQGDGNWLSEGLASYYQNVLRARSGMLSSQQAWQKLDAGFERGRDQALPTRTLAQITDAMVKNRLFMRVYWSGAAFSLETDYRLRHNEGLSLDKVLYKYKQCCLPADRPLTASALVAKWDELSNTRWFEDLYRGYANSTDFPSLAGMYDLLGINQHPSGLRFNDKAASAAIRRQIMQPLE